MASKFSQEEKLNAAKKLANQVVGTENAGIGIKPYYAEEFPWIPIIPPNKIWSQIDEISGATNESQAISVAAAIPSIVERVKVRLTSLNTSNNNAYVARSTYNNTSSNVLDNWIQPQLIRTITNDSSLGYSVNLYHGDPDSGGTLLPTNYEGLDGEPSWEWYYSSGILVVAEDENTTYHTFYNTNGLWIQGFRYVGETGGTGGGSSGGTVPDNLEVLDITINQSNSFQNYQPVYYNPISGDYELAIASGDTTTAQYIVFDVTSSSFKIAHSGFLSATAHGLGNNGDILYVSQTSGGIYTINEPSNGIINPMIEIVDNNQLLIVNSPVFNVLGTTSSLGTLLEDWQSSLFYDTNELVKFQKGTYRCEVPHTSNIFQNDLSANRWSVISNTDAELPINGSTGNVLVKRSGTDYDTLFTGDVFFEKTFDFVGSGSGTTVNLIHNLDTEFITFSCRNINTNVFVNPTFTYIDNDTINVSGNLDDLVTFRVTIHAKSLNF